MTFPFLNPQDFSFISSSSGKIKEIFVSSVNANAQMLLLIEEISKRSGKLSKIYFFTISSDCDRELNIERQYQKALLRVESNQLLIEKFKDINHSNVIANKLDFLIKENDSIIKVVNRRTFLFKIVKFNKNAFIERVNKYISLVDEILYSEFSKHACEVKVLEVCNYELEWIQDLFLVVNTKSSCINFLYYCLTIEEQNNLNHFIGNNNTLQRLFNKNQVSKKLNTLFENYKSFKAHEMPFDIEGGNFIFLEDIILIGKDIQVDMLTLKKYFLGKTIIKVGLEKQKKNFKGKLSFQAAFHLDLFLNFYKVKSKYYMVFSKVLKDEEKLTHQESIFNWFIDGIKCNLEAQFKELKIDLNFKYIPIQIKNNEIIENYSNSIIEQVGQYNYIYMPVYSDTDDKVKQVLKKVFNDFNVHFIGEADGINFDDSLAARGSLHCLTKILGRE